MIPLELKKIKSWMYCNEKNNAPADKDGKICSYTDKKNLVNYNDKTNVFILDNNYTAIDFDMCLDENGNVYNWAKEFVDVFINKGFYVEYSRSKRGLHVIGKGSLPKNISIKMQQIHKKFSNLHKKSGIEIFVKHAITLTGDIYNNMPGVIPDINENFNILFKHLVELSNRNINKQHNYNNDDDIFNYVKSSISLKQVFAYYGIEYNTRKNISCPLPAHTDKKPSFSFDDSKDLFYCHSGCGGGTIIDFIMKMENLNNLDAAKFLIDKFNLELNIDKNIINPQFVDSFVDIFEKINNYLSENNKSEMLELSDTCFLPSDYKAGYYMVDKGFCKRYICKITNDIGEKEEIYSDKIIIPIKIYPTKIFFVDGTEEVEYNNKLLCENDSFSSVAKIKTWLKKLGKFLYFDGDTNDLVHFEKYIITYKKFNNMEQIKAVSKLGWTKDNKFNPYACNELFVKDDSIETKMLIESFTQNGDFETWKENIIKYSENDIFRIYLNTSLSSPLTSLLKRPSFWVHNYAKQSSGKTPALYAAASIWANPEKFAPAFNTTRVGLEFKLHTLGNLPCLFDDSQNLNEWSRKHISSLIYDVVNGHGKTRGNIKGELQMSKYWYTNMLTNGEQPLLNGNEFEGAIKRLMEFDTIPFKNHIEARNARKIFLCNYGFLGEKFIKLIVKYKNEIDSLLEPIEELINNNINYPTHIQNVATMAICDYILNYYMFNLDQETSFDNAVIWSERILKLLPCENETDKTTIGMELIKEFILSNTHRFRNECPQGRVGFFRQGEVYFFKNEFNKLLDDWNIPIKQFLKDIKDMDISITDNLGQFKQIKYNGRNIRPIGLYNEDITDIAYDINDYR